MGYWSMQLVKQGLEDLMDVNDGYGRHTSGRHTESFYTSYDLEESERKSRVVKKKSLEKANG